MNDNSSSSPNDPLDRLLQDWSDKQAPDAEHFNELRQRVLLSCQAVDHALPDQSRKVNRNAMRWSMQVRIALVSLAASLLIGTLIWKQYEDPARPIAASIANEERSNNDAHPTQSSSASPSQQEHVRQEHVLVDFTKQKLLMRKLLSIYDQPLMWVAESQDALQVELARSPEQAQVDADQPWLLIRLTVESQKAPEPNSQHYNAAQAKPLWQLDLLVRNEQVVNLSDRADHDQQLMVWPYLTEDGLVMIDTQFAGLGPMKNDGNQTNLVRPGSRTRLTSVNDQYALCQYVEVIH